MEDIEIKSGSVTFIKPVNNKNLDDIKKAGTKIKTIIFGKGALNSIRGVIEDLSNDNIEYQIVLDNNKQYDINSFIKLQQLSPKIFICHDFEIVSIAEYVEYQKKLNNLLEPIKDLELSPLEKYLFVYKTAAQFRKYKENEDDKNNARKLSKLFKEDNTDIVCVGFASILKALCIKLGIYCDYTGLKVNTVYGRTDEERELDINEYRAKLNRARETILTSWKDSDEVSKDLEATLQDELELCSRDINSLIRISLNSEKPQSNLNGENDKHALLAMVDNSDIDNEIERLVTSTFPTIVGHGRNIIYIKDDKYNIDGIYLADATWDNYLEHEIYVHALMTPYEADNHKTANYRSYDVAANLLTAQSYKEFIELLYIDFRAKDTKNGNFLDLILTFNKAFPEFKERIKQFPSYLKFQIEKEPKKEDFRNLFLDDELLQMIFNEVYSKANNIISGQTIVDAAMNLNNVLNPNQKQIDRDKTRFKLIRGNRHIYEKTFPTVFIEKSTGTTIRANEFNKYNIIDNFYVDKDNKIWFNEQEYLDSLNKKEEPKEEKPTNYIRHLDNELYVQNTDEEFEEGHIRR